MATGKIVQVFNRTNRVLIVVKDGIETPLKPGYNHITQDLVLYAKQQHPIPGSEDAVTTEYESLVSFVQPDKKDQVDSLDVISDDVLASLPKERINRMTLPADRQDGTSVQAHFPRGRMAMENPTDGVMNPVEDTRSGG